MISFMPIFCRLLEVLAEVVEGKVALLQLLLLLLQLFLRELLLDFSPTFSTNPIMSPWPMIREAMLSGRNNSRAFSFSPTPMNLMGTLVMFLDR